jgi:thiol-disulfide isomerase/thioredoxin
MEKKINWLMTSLLLAIVSLGLVVSCASLKTGATPATLSPVKITDIDVERLNPMSKDKFQKNDVFVFSTTFTFSNPQQTFAKISDFYFEVKVDDGTADKTIIQTGSMPITYIPAGEEISWSYTSPLIYGGMIGSYILRGIGGGIKGAVGTLNGVWKDLGGDKKTFYIKARYATSLPDCPGLGKKFQEFSSEFKIPAL